MIYMKKKIITTIVLAFGAMFMLGIISGFKPFNEKKPWPVPDKDKNMRNPIASDAVSIKAGKTLYEEHCKSCHGTKGLGDGTKATNLKTEPGNFSTPEFQAQTDGALFYKTSVGRDEMKPFNKKIPDADDRWSLVNFMRTFKISR